MRESVNSRKSSALSVKSVDSNMNKKNKKKKDEEQTELPSKKNQDSPPACFIHSPENPNDLYLNTELFYIMSSCFDQVLCPFL